jgi:hypothetical protein
MRFSRRLQTKPCLLLSIAEYKLINIDDCVQRRGTPAERRGSSLARPTVVDVAERLVLMMLKSSWSQWQRHVQPQCLGPSTIKRWLGNSLVPLRIAFTRG